MKAAAFGLLAVVAVAALLWTGGETHRANCVRDGHTDCSMLVWKDGKPKPRKPRSQTLPPGLCDPRPCGLRSFGS